MSDEVRRVRVSQNAFWPYDGQICLDHEYGTHMLVPVKAWPKLSPELLGKIGDEIIRQTGDGPLAIYVVKFLKEIGADDE